MSLYRIRLLAIFTILLTLMPQTVSASDSKSALDEQILEQIKQRLVEEAQEANTRVTSSAWLSEDGQLHESTFIRSDLVVRGIQVRRYLDEMNAPKVEIALNQKEGAIPECFQADDHLARTVELDVTTQNLGISPEVSDWLVAAKRIVESDLKMRLDRSQSWIVRAPADDKQSEYMSLLTGTKARAIQYRLTVHIGRHSRELSKASQTPGENILRDYFYGRPSEFAKQALVVSVQLSDAVKGFSVWDSEFVAYIAPRKISYTTEQVDDNFVRAIRQGVEQLFSSLTDIAACQPIRFYISQIGSEFVTVGGHDVGLEVGDQILLVDERNVVERIFEPGSLKSLSLLRVTKVLDDRAFLDHTAGASVDRLAERVGIPF
jgi:hypothetical protein